MLAKQVHMHAVHVLRSTSKEVGAHAVYAACRLECLCAVVFIAVFREQRGTGVAETKDSARLVRPRQQVIQFLALGEELVILLLV